MKLHKDFSLSPVELLAASFFVVISWQRYLLSAPYSSLYVTLQLFAVFLVMTVLAWIFSRRRQFKLSLLTVLFILVIVLVLIIFPPAYQYWLGVTITNKFINSLEIRVKLQSREVNLLDSADDTSESRNIRTVYVLTEEPELVQKQIHRILKPLNRWYFDESGMNGTCQLDILKTTHYSFEGVGIALRMDASNRLYVYVGYRNPEQCLITNTSHH